MRRVAASRSRVRRRCRARATDRVGRARRRDATARRPSRRETAEARHTGRAGHRAGRAGSAPPHGVPRRCARASRQVLPRASASETCWARRTISLSVNVRGHQRWSMATTDRRCSRVIVSTRSGPSARSTSASRCRGAWPRRSIPTAAAAAWVLTSGGAHTSAAPADLTTQLEAVEIDHVVEPALEEPLCRRRPAQVGRAHDECSTCQRLTRWSRGGQWAPPPRDVHRPRRSRSRTRSRTPPSSLVRRARLSTIPNTGAPTRSSRASASVTSRSETRLAWATTSTPSTDASERHRVGDRQHRRRVEDRRSRSEPRGRARSAPTRALDSISLGFGGTCPAVTTWSPWSRWLTTISTVSPEQRLGQPGAGGNGEHLVRAAACAGRRRRARPRDRPGRARRRGSSRSSSCPRRAASWSPG